MTKKQPLKSKVNHNFWNELRKPFFALAPMADVTDAVFRKLTAKYGKPDVMWTEFVSADGLISVGKKNLMHNLNFSEKERPIVAQLFTGSPEAMKEAVRLIAELGFDGLDINMGCPDRSVEKQGGGAKLIKESKLAVKIIHAAREGWGNFQGPIFNFQRSTDQGMFPISVKTRLGYNKIDLDWIRILLEQELPVLTIHLRTRKEMSDVPAHWEIMPKIVKLRNEIAPDTLIIGNGDVETVEQGFELAKKYGCDGVMIGRGIFGKPWLFENLASFKNEDGRTPQEILKILLEHAKLFEKTFKGIINFDVMKKHFKAYVSGWEGAKELRVALMGTKNAKEVAAVVSSTRTVLSFPRRRE